MDIVEPRYLVKPHPWWKDAASTGVLVIGGGVAGLRAALAAAEYAPVLVATKYKVRDSNTYRAQGGIAIPLGGSEDEAGHLQDTIAAGAGLVDAEMAAGIVAEGVKAAGELIGWGARFDLDGGELSLGREGGHGRSRILHAGGDATGREIAETLEARARAHPAIRMTEDTFAIDIITGHGRCLGAMLWHAATGLQAVRADAVVLATGGCGRLWRETTNPPVATGDGVPMAWRAGAAVADLEFMQFHPTALYLAGAPRFLISEAVRGEGAILRDRDGERFMPGVHPAAELASRDVVSRAIEQRMTEKRDTCVFLDLTGLSYEHVRSRFPTICRVLDSFALDPTREWVPVRPAAHYMIGGVWTDGMARTDLPGLFAAGESACTGFHGANRLASNSLLEGLVMGRRAGEEAGLLAAGTSRTQSSLALDPSDSSGGAAFEVDVEDVRASLRAVMTRRVGAGRSAEGLGEASEALDRWCRYVLSRSFREPSGWELVNLLTLGRLIVRMALAREESRGTHSRSDHSERDDERFGRHSVLKQR